MTKKLKYLVPVFCVVTLTSCLPYAPNDRPYATYAYDDSQLYAQSYYYARGPEDRYFGNQYSQGGVTVPESYHVGAFHSPVSSKERDKNWARGQNPEAYTIEIADSDKAAAVAQKLYKAPKGDHMGQVKYNRNGKSYYKGLYGTYDNAEAAQKALDSLPADIKQGAGVKNWGSVQSNLND